MESEFCNGVSDGYDDDEAGRGKRTPRHYGGSDEYWRGYNAGYAFNEQEENGEEVPQNVLDCFDPTDEED